MESPVAKAAPIARIPFRSAGGHIILPIRVNGSRELTTILDTGMSAPIVMLLHPDLGPEIGIGEGEPVQIAGAGDQGAVAGRLHRGVTVQIGEITQAEQTVIVMEGGRDSSRWTQDGVIGKSIFDQFAVAIDFEDSAVSLHDAGLLDAPGFESIPMPLTIGIPRVDATIEIDSGAMVEVQLVVDLGARHTLSLHADASKGLILPEKTMPAVLGRGILGEVQGRVGRIRSLRLGPFLLSNVICSFAGRDSGVACANHGSGADGNLGIEILRRFQVVVDYPRRRLLLAPRPGLDRPFEFNMAGLSLEQAPDGSYRVRSVMESSPGSEAGIAAGDHVTAIDDQDLAVAKDVDAKELFEREGAILRLTVERESVPFVCSVRLRRCI